MGAKTAIGWTDATVNFWWGCTKVGPGCDHCYAEKWDQRTGGAHWGVGVPRRKIASAERLIGRLNDKQPGTRAFVQSMSDLFDVEVPLEWFDHAWNCIHAAERLRLQIVTKRVSVIEKRLAQIWHGTWPKHAGLIITVVNQEEADRDVPRALALKAKLRIPWLGLSIEPQLGPIMLPVPRAGGLWHLTTTRGAPNGEPWLADPDGHKWSAYDLMSFECVDWVISGGESKQGKDHEPRVYDLAWARSLRDQCAAAGVAYFQKQVGSMPFPYLATRLKDRAGADPAEWPEDLRVQQFPEALR